MNKALKLLKNVIIKFNIKKNQVTELTRFFLSLTFVIFVNDDIHLPDRSRARGLLTGSWDLSAPVRISPRFLARRTAGNVG